MKSHTNFDLPTKTDNLPLYIEKEKRIIPICSSQKGDFHWFYGDPDPKKSVEGLKKAQFVADLGCLPDNGILSNKLINVYGKRVFDLVHDKSKSVEDKKSFRKKVAVKIGLASETIDDNKRLDIQLNWRMVKKIRALQQIDRLFNLPTKDFEKNYETLIDDAIKALLQIKIECEMVWKKEGYLHDVLTLEYEEIGSLHLKLLKLKGELETIKSKDKYHRNGYLQDWQRETFVTLNENFKKHQGIVGLYGKTVPLPTENVSNSNTLTDAEYAVQDHIYSESNPFRTEQLWLFGIKGEESHVLASDSYCQNGNERKRLLMAACLSEKVGELENPFSFSKSTEDSFDVLTHELKQARALYREKNKVLRDSSLAAKEKAAEEKKKIAEEKKKIPIPQKIETYFKNLFIDDVTGLKTSSRELSQYGLAIKQMVREQEYIDKPLITSLAKLNANLPSENNDETLEDTDELASMESSKVPAHSNYKYAPIPQPVVLNQVDDIFNATLDFASYFFLFFDRDLMAKRPYLSLLFFSIPFTQIALPALAGSSVALAKLMSLILSGEAALAKFSGLDALVKAAFHQELTAEQLGKFIELVRHTFNWLTSAESSFEQALVGSIVAKLTFNTADLALNGIWGNKDSALLSEYFTTLFDAKGPEGTTLSEDFKNCLVTVGLYTAKLLITVYGLAGTEAILPALKLTALKPFLTMLANIPLYPLIHPHLDINLIQTVGTAKSGALVVFKILGILGQVNGSEFYDVDGSQLKENSASVEVLEFFYRLKNLSQGKRNEYLIKHSTSPDYLEAKNRLEELLNRNPALWKLFQDRDGSYAFLKACQVERIVTRWYCKYPMAVVKIVPALIKMTVGLIPAIYTLFVFAQSKLSDKTPIECTQNKVARLTYKIGLESLNSWVKVGKVAWTATKAVLHSFVKVGIRVLSLEVPVGLLFTALFVATTLLRPVGYVGQLIANQIVNKPEKNPWRNNPIASLSRWVTKAHADVAKELKVNFRQPIESLLSTGLRICRNVFVRKVEREMQVPEPEKKVKGGVEIPHLGDSFDIFKKLQSQGKVNNVSTKKAIDLEGASPSVISVSDTKKTSNEPILNPVDYQSTITTFQRNQTTK